MLILAFAIQEMLLLCDRNNVDHRLKISVILNPAYFRPRPSLGLIDLSSEIFSLTQGMECKMVLKDALVERNLAILCHSSLN